MKIRLFPAAARCVTEHSNMPVGKPHPTYVASLQLNDAPLAIVDKRRSSHNVSEVMNLIGDVKDKVAVLVDDMIDTAGTITNAAKVDSLQWSSLWRIVKFVVDLMAAALQKYHIKKGCIRQSHGRFNCMPIS